MVRSILFFQSSRSTLISARTREPGGEERDGGGTIRIRGRKGQKRREREESLEMIPEGTCACRWSYIMHFVQAYSAGEDI